MVKRRTSSHAGSKLFRNSLYWEMAPKPPWQQRGTKKTRNQASLPTDNEAMHAACSLAMLSKRTEIFKLCTTPACKEHGALWMVVLGRATCQCRRNSKRA